MAHGDFDCHEDAGVIERAGSAIKEILDATDKIESLSKMPLTPYPLPIRWGEGENTRTLVGMYDESCRTN
jgi:hypothetical protein